MTKEAQFHREKTTTRFHTGIWGLTRASQIGGVIEGTLWCYMGYCKRSKD